MMLHFANRRLFDIGIYLATLVTLIDQGTKNWILDLITSPFMVVRVNDFLNLRLSWNRGVTFGLFNHEAQWQSYVFAVIAFAILLFLLSWLMRATTLIAAVGIGLIVGGAVGNVIDRMRFGAVVDFLDLHVGNHHWYTFNAADSAIVGGVILLMIENLVTSQKKM